MAFTSDKTRQAAAGASGGATEGFIVGKADNYSHIIGVSFASSGWTEDWGDLSVRRSTSAASASSTHGYVNGGTIGSGIHYNTIDRWSFDTTGNATDVGDLTLARSGTIGTQSSTRGFTMGGSAGYATFTYNNIDAYTFASSSNASDWGDTLNEQSCSGGIGWAGGVHDSSNGYIMGGYTPCGGTWYNQDSIQKFSMSSGSNASNWASMSANGGSSIGASSSSHGYSIAGTWNHVSRIAFSSGGTMSSWCNLPTGRESGYRGATHLGDDVITTKAVAADNVVQDKFSMASTSDAVSWGDLNAISWTGWYETGGTIQMDMT